MNQWLWGQAELLVEKPDPGDVVMHTLATLELMGEMNNVVAKG